MKIEKKLIALYKKQCRTIQKYVLSYQFKGGHRIRTLSSIKSLQAYLDFLEDTQRRHLIIGSIKIYEYVACIPKQFNNLDTLKLLNSLHKRETNKGGKNGKKKKKL